jgi:hypothetical protein
MVKAKGGAKRSPLEYLEDILNRALSLNLIAVEEVSQLLAQGDTIQDNIDIWRPVVREAENEPTREWVVTAKAFFRNEEVNERVDDMIYSSYTEACDRCRSLNATTDTSATKPKKCRVVELKDSVVHGQGEGRSCYQLLELADLGSLCTDGTHNEGVEPIEDETIDWDELLGHGNGYLALRNKNIVDIDVPGVIACVSLAGGRVTQLGLSQNSLKGVGASSLMTNLLQPVNSFKNICALFLSNNSIGDEGALAVASFLNSQELPIAKLGLNSNDITDVGAEAIAYSLQNTDDRTSIMEVIGLSHNLITSKGAFLIANALTNNSSLQRLFLNYNPLVGDRGGVALANAASGHTSLLRLGVAFCSLESKSGEALIGAMNATDSLERICVSGNCFDDDTVGRMEEIARFNFSEVK